MYAILAPGRKRHRRLRRRAVASALACGGCGAGGSRLRRCLSRRLQRRLGERRVPRQGDKGDGKRRGNRGNLHYTESFHEVEAVYFTVYRQIWSSRHLVI